MIALLHFLLASCFLIGCFANFAGNEYGMDLAEKATIAFMLLLFGRGIFAAKNARKISSAKAAMLLAEYWLVAIGTAGVLMKVNNLPGAALLMAGFLFACITFFFRAVWILYRIARANNRFVEMQSALLLLFCSTGLYSSLAKFMYWPGAFYGLLTGLALLFLMSGLEIWNRFRGFRFAEPGLPSRDYSPVKAYFYILLVGNLHFIGFFLGWVPGFQYPSRPLALNRLMEEPETTGRNQRIDCYRENMDVFFQKRRLDAYLSTKHSSDLAIMDSLHYVLPK